MPFFICIVNYLQRGGYIWTPHPPSNLTSVAVAAGVVLNGRDKSYKHYPEARKGLFLRRLRLGVEKGTFNPENSILAYLEGF